MRPRIPAVSPKVLLERINGILGSRPLNEQQGAAFFSSFSEPLALLWGPPGTGKTTTAAAIVLGWLEEGRAANRSIRIGVGATSYSAIENALREIAALVNRWTEQQSNYLAPPEVTIACLRGMSYDPVTDSNLASYGIRDIPNRSAEADALADRLAEDETAGFLIVGGTWQQLGTLAATTRAKEQGSVASDVRSGQWFDFLLIDEAAQMPVSHAAAYYLLLRENAHVLLAGDDRQLGPVYAFQVENDADGLCDCIYTYSRVCLGIEPVALQRNYRSNETIIGWPRRRFYPQGYVSDDPDKRLHLPPLALNSSDPPVDWPTILPWSPHLPAILDPALPVTVIVYPAASWTMSNPFEAQLAAALCHLVYTADAPHTAKAITDFWKRRIAVITPHRAQVAAIHRLLLGNKCGVDAADRAVDTVDRFQGSERDVIIATYSVADEDFIAQEAGFILDPRRFNVTLTRARSKFILLVSDAVLAHLPATAELAQAASHLQLFVSNYCQMISESWSLPYLDSAGSARWMPCRLYGRH